MDHRVLGDHGKGFPITLSIRITDDVHRIVEGRIAGQKFLKLLNGLRGKCRHGQTGTVCRISGENPRSAGVGDDRKVRSFGQRLGGKSLSKIEK